MNKLMFGVLAAGILLFSSRVNAQDSENLIGDDGKIALLTFESRDGAAGRSTAVTLVYGINLLQGEFKTANPGVVDSGSVTLEVKHPEGHTPVYSGTVQIDYEKKQMTLKGRITLHGSDEPLKIDTTFPCKELTPPR